VWHKRQHMQKICRKVFPLFFTTLFLTMLLLASCVSEIDPKFSFNIDRRFASTINASGSGIDTTLSFNIADTANEFLEQSTTRDRVESATLLKIGAQSNSSLSVFDSIEYFVTSDALPRVHIGTLKPMPDATRFLINPVDTNIAEYSKLEQFTLEAHVLSSRPLAQDTRLDIEQTFLIVATPRH
jgi:hypothetical protein